MGPVHVYCISEDCGPLAIGPLDAAGLGAPTTVALGGLACVASHLLATSPAAVSRDELVRKLLVHQRVVEHVMQSRAVLPVKFGTVLSNTQEVLDLLVQGREQFLGALVDLSDKVEVEIAATWDLDRVLRETGAEDDVVRARQSLAHPARMEDRVRLGQVVKACLDRRRNSYRLRMVGYLQALTSAAAQHALLTDRLVMNVAFLVERRNLPEFDARVRRLDALFNNEITFRVIGPLPPYSFSTVEIARTGPREIGAARSLLGMEEVLTETEVKRAYRHTVARLARECKPGEQLDAERLAQVRRASDLLLACARGQNGPGSQTAPAATRAFIIRIKGAHEEDVEPTRFGQAAPAIA